MYVMSPFGPHPNMWVVAFSDRDVCLRLATAFHDWTVLVVGDVKTPTPELRHSHCVYFTPDVKASSTPAHLSVKTAAFYYAIKSGAEGVYIADLARTVLVPDLLMTNSTQAPGLMVSATQKVIFNSVTHWGCNQSGTSDPSADVSYTYSLCGARVAAIQTTASLVRMDTGPEGVLDPLESCDVCSPSVLLSPNLMTLIRPEGTLFLEPAFWALAVSEAQTAEEGFALSVMTQELLMLRGDRLQVRLGEKMPTTHFSSQFVADMKRLNLDCDKDKEDFLLCVEQSIRKLSELNLISSETWSNCVALLKSLRSLHHYVGGTVTGNVCLTPRPLEYFPVSYNVPYRIKSWKPTAFVPVNNIYPISSLFRDTCGMYEKTASTPINFKAPWVQWEDVLLIIVFNNPHYDVIPFTEVLYRSFFPHILYCGPQNPDNVTSDTFHRFQVSFVSYGGNPAGHFAGSFNYECVSLAVRMSYKVRGYLVIADDMVLVPDKLRKLKTDRIWYLPDQDVRTANILTLLECRLGACNYRSPWRWWEEYQDAVVNVLTALEARRAKSPLVNQCLERLKASAGGANRIHGGYSDIYYLPKYLATDFVELASVFREHYVFLELTVPTIIKCLAPREEIVPLSGRQIWDDSREESWSYFTKRDMAYQSYLHPVKWSYVTQGSPAYTQMFCYVTLYLHDKYGRIHEVQTL